MSDWGLKWCWVFDGNIGEVLVMVYLDILCCFLVCKCLVWVYFDIEIGLVFVAVFGYEFILVFLDGWFYLRLSCIVLEWFVEGFLTFVVRVIYPKIPNVRVWCS